MDEEKTTPSLSQTSQALIFALFSMAGLFTLAYATGIGPVSPSDPMQYHAGSFSAGAHFPFFDRLVLMVSLKIFALMLPVDAYLAPVMTLSYVLGAAGLAGFWLYQRFGRGAATLFMVVFASAPAWMSIASYSYPMQCLSFFLILYLVAADRLGTSQWRYLILGVISVFILFSKVQGAGILCLTCAEIALRREGWVMNLVRYAIGGVIGLALLLGLILMFLGPTDMVAMFKEALFGATLSGQIKGRGEGGIPPYFVYLFQPHYWLAFLGLLLPFIVVAPAHGPHLMTASRHAAFVGLGQFGFLMLIYILTWRGGPPISNYILDSFTCGLISLSILLGTVKPLRHIKFSHALLMVAGVILLLVITSYQVENTHLFLQNYQDLGADFLYFILVGGSFAGLSGIWLAHRLTPQFLPRFIALKANAFSMAILGLAVLLLALSSSLGVREAKFRHDYASRHHDAAMHIAARLGQAKEHKQTSSHLLAGFTDEELPDLGYGKEDARARISTLLPLYQ
ncbi:MAG: hypothetical protein ACON4Q_01835 [Candidatus Puniceispirillaceae bacterium]